jgi:hypothetical protein
VPHRAADDSARGPAYPRPSRRRGRRDTSEHPSRIMLPLA